MDKHPRCLIVDLSTKFGGASTRVINLLRKLPAGSSALASLDNSPVTKQANKIGIEVFTVGKSKYDPRIVIGLKKIISENNFLVFDTQNIQSKFWSNIARIRSNTALVSTLNSWYRSELGGTPKGRIYKYLEHITTLPTDCYIAVSNEIFTRLLDSGVSDDSITLISNAVDINPSAVKSDRNWLTSQYNIPSNSVICSAAGRLVKAKNYESLVFSISKLSKYPIHCLIAGSGNLQYELEKQISSLKLASRIRVLGFKKHEEVLKIIKGSDMFIMPSISEGTPVALLEAAALGCPIIAGNVGGIPDILENNKHGLLINPCEQTELTRSIKYLIDHPDEALLFGKQAAEHIARNFRIESQVEATLNVYRKAVLRMNKEM
jgi:glycosyltransferase involved in cell wall biosynthesis